MGGGKRQVGTAGNDGFQLQGGRRKQREGRGNGDGVSSASGNRSGAAAARGEASKGAAGGAAAARAGGEISYEATMDLVIAGKGPAVLRGPTTKLWGCSCGCTGNFASRVRCLRCKNLAPYEFLRKAVAEDVAFRKKQASNPIKPGGGPAAHTAGGKQSEELKQVLKKCADLEAKVQALSAPEAKGGVAANANHKGDEAATAAQPGASDNGKEEREKAKAEAVAARAKLAGRIKQTNDAINLLDEKDEANAEVLKILRSRLEQDKQALKEHDERVESARVKAAQEAAESKTPERQLADVKVQLARNEREQERTMASIKSLSVEYEQIKEKLAKANEKFTRLDGENAKLLDRKAALHSTAAASAAAQAAGDQQAKPAVDGGRMALAFYTPELYEQFGKKLDAVLEGMAAELLDSQTAMEVDALGGPVETDPVKGMPDCQLRYLLSIAQRQRKEKAERVEDAPGVGGGTEQGAVEPPEKAAKSAEGGGLTADEVEAAFAAASNAGPNGPLREKGSNRADPYGAGQGQQA